MLQNLWPLELSINYWAAISIITQWLQSFWDAMTHMSATMHMTPSLVHFVFHGLQEALKGDLLALPHNAPLQLKQSLIEAHQKLSDYPNKFDDSPYYVWVRHECLVLMSCCDAQLIINIYTSPRPPCLIQKTESGLQG